MSKKGLSLQEKRERMLDLLHETKEFYKLADLEKLAPKAKGITSMSVKEVLTDLVNDNLVCFEKVGIMNFYWSFPSSVGVALQVKKDKLSSSITELNSEVEKEEAEVDEMEKGREETKERITLLAQYNELKSEVEALELEERNLKESDPGEWKEKEELCDLLKTSTQFWTGEPPFSHSSLPTLLPPYTALDPTFAHSSHAENIASALHFMYKDAPLSEEERKEMERDLGLNDGWDNDL